MIEQYDMVVIGGGAAGLVASGFAGKLGLKVALIEREALGGDCTWTGCMPSKALLKVAKTAHTARTSAQYGVRADAVTVDMRQVRDHVQGIVQRIYAAETPEEFSKRGVDIIIGEGRFIDSHTIQVNERQLCAKRIIIASGGRPNIPAIEGLGRVPFKTSRSIFQNDVLPSTFLVLGAGPIGAEMAQAYARLGSKVILIGQQLLERDEPEARVALQHVLEREGVCFVQGRVVSAQMMGEEILLRMDNGEELRGEMLLVATGRRPNIESLDLDKAGVAFTPQGITVNAALQTSQRHIYAIGDCIGGPYFTHRSGFQAAQAARNAIFPGSSAGLSDVLPWVTFTDPEVAHVGLTEHEARAMHGTAVKTYLFSLTHGDRAVTEDDTDGFIKLVYKGSGKLLGVTIVAGRAGEMLTEFALAMKNGLNLRDITATIHAYPTYSDIVHKAVSEAVIEELFSGLTGKIIQRITRLFW